MCLNTYEFLDNDKPTIDFISVTKKTRLHMPALLFNWNNIKSEYGKIYTMHYIYIICRLFIVNFTIKSYNTCGIGILSVNAILISDYSA